MFHQLPYDICEFFFSIFNVGNYYIKGKKEFISCD